MLALQLLSQLPGITILGWNQITLLDNKSTRVNNLPKINATIHTNNKTATEHTGMQCEQKFMGNSQVYPVSWEQ